MQQHRFRLIPGVMRQRDRVRADFIRRPVQEFVAQRPRGVLQPAAVRSCVRRGVDMGRIERDALFLAQHPDKRQIRKRCLTADAVLHMGAGERKRHAFARLKQQAEKRHRVRAAAEGQQHMAAGGNAAVLR